MRSHFSRIWRKIYVRIELRGIGSCLRVLRVVLGIVRFEGVSDRPIFRPPVSTAIYWFAYCSISDTVTSGHLINDQKNLVGFSLSLRQIGHTYARVTVPTSSRMYIRQVGHTYARLTMLR
ncbi:hypothetical protein BHM03_00013517 [Ensete ventricosum]|nr:hypothetical protein BHM03_00013517 [Ensete ventricosum]